MDEVIDFDAYPIRKDKDQKIVKELSNLVNCFYIDENLLNLFIYNEFDGCVEYNRDALWHDVKKGQELRDKDITFIQYYFSRNKGLDLSKELIMDVITEIAERKKYHPIRLYLSQLEWDGIGRLDEWLIHTCGTEDNEYIRAIGSKFIMAAVGRVYHPGIKFDNVLVLEGPENIGKSTVFRTWSHPWFTDSIDLMQKDEKIIEKMRGNWFLEVAEMFGVSESNQERIKSFLTRQDDVHRLPWDRLAQRIKRQSVFCASSNKLAYLFGEDGNRRFWPAKCEKINIEWLKENKNQLFAEAKHRFQAGENLFLNNELFKFAQRVQNDKLTVNDVWYEEIDRFLMDKDIVSMKEILIDCLKMELKELHNRSLSINVGRILKKLGFEKKDMGKDHSVGNRYMYAREQELAQREIKRLQSEADLEEE